MQIGFRKFAGAFAATVLGVAAFAVPSAAAVPQRETGFLSCLTDASGLASISFVPTLTGVVAFEDTSSVQVTGTTGAEAETDGGTAFPRTTFAKAEAGVEQIVDVAGPPTTSCNIPYSVDETPANDLQSAAAVLTGASGSIDGSTRAATLDVPDEPQPVPDANRVVWYRWTAPTTANMRFDVEPTGAGTSYLESGTIFTSLCLAIYGPANHFTPLILGGNPVADGQSAHGGQDDLQVTAGTAYDIAVCSGGGTGDFASPFGYTAPGSFTLTWAPVVSGPLPTIVPGHASIVEGNTGTKTLNLPVTLSASSTAPVTAKWNTAFVDAGNEHEARPASAFAGDYDDASGVVTFAPGQTSATVPITITADLMDEWDELFLVSFHDPTNAKVGGFYGLGLASITDDDAPPVIIPSLGQRRVGELDFRLVTGFDVRLSAPSGKTVTVEISTPFPAAAGVATPGQDFVGGNGVITFGASFSSFPTVTILPDDIPEPDEVIGFVLRNAVNATIGGYYGIGSLTINANDGG